MFGDPWGTAPKRGEDLCGIDMYHLAHFHADQRELSVPGQKKTHFPYRDSPGGYRPLLEILRKLSSS